VFTTTSSYKLRTQKNPLSRALLALPFCLITKEKVALLLLFYGDLLLLFIVVIFCAKFFRRGSFGSLLLFDGRYLTAAELTDH